MNTIPFDIPSNWTWTTMGKIADVVGGSTPRTNDPENYEGGTIPWITPADLSGYTAKNISHGERFITSKGLAGSSAKMMPSGTVLFSSRAPVGYVAITANPVCTNQGFKSFVLKTNSILPDYIYWWLKGSKDLAESLASGTTFLELSGAKAKQLPIPIAPVGQQRSIVAEIEKQFSRLDQAVANLKRVKANLKRYRAAVLKAAVEGKLTEDWRKQHPDVEPASKLLERILAERREKWHQKGKYKEPAMPSIGNPTAFHAAPDGWTFVSMEQLLPSMREAMKTGPFGSLLKKHEHMAEGVAVLGIENIEAMRFVRGSKIHITQKKAEDLTDYKVVPDDVLISRSGTVGEVCVVPEDIGEARISTNLMKVSLARDGMLPKFFILLFNGSPFVLNQVSDLCKGSTRCFLNQKILKQLCFVLPPLPEQREIIAEVELRLSVVEELEAAVQANLTRANRLRQSILKRAFEGKLIKTEPPQRSDFPHELSLAAESSSSYGGTR